LDTTKCGNLLTYLTMIEKISARYPFGPSQTG
jgi:hypothetical protein